jgi:hypothetical protein
MLPTARAGATPRPISRRTPIAALLALLAVAVVAQAIAPAGAGAVINEPPNPSSCMSIGGVWVDGACYISDGEGGAIRVNEISAATGIAPGQPPCRGLSCLPYQIGPGSRQSGDGSGSDSKARGPAGIKGGIRGPKVKPKKPLKSSGPKVEELEVCKGLRLTLKTYATSIDAAVKELDDYYKQGGDANTLMKKVAYRDLLRKVYNDNLKQYVNKECLAYTGPPPFPGSPQK